MTDFAPVNKRAGIRPPWLKIRVPGDLNQLPVAKLMNDLALNTVCQEARCPNIFECWAAGTATFMVLGEICTRRCTFCAVSRGTPGFSDLEGNRDALNIVIDAKPEVLAHNIETVPRLYAQVRPVAKYARSLDVLRWAHEAGMLTKSSLMLGLGETEDEILDVARDLRGSGVDIFT